MTTTTVSVADLRQALRVILPFTDRTGMPVMEAVHLEADNHNLVATASDRYILGHIRILAAGDALPSTVVPRPAVQLVRRALDDLPASMVAHLRRIKKLHGPDFLEVDTDVLTIRVKALDATYPKVLHLLDQDSDQPSGLNAPVNLDPARAHPFAKAAKTLGVAAVRWTFHGDKKSARVEIGRTFVGLVMPGKVPHNFDPTPVPVGLAQRAPA